ncbi:MAG: HDOD domain-containing protein [Candidatus Thiodiazotropha sp. (ex Monitilora ramsayi)]|nr:HDOD domain-containing protein [Candidatus Thiodiazotropha sp. (ex Monitilora ramsayi)]
MTQSAHEQIDRLSGEPLPVLQRTLTHVRDMLQSSSVNHARLSETISRDPGFSLHILRKLNELPNPPKEPINKISLAIPLLGMDRIENAAQTLPCLEDKLKGPPRRGLIDCYSRGAHAAFYADAIGRQRGDSESGCLYSAALLHDIGEMALWSQTPKQMHEIRQRIMQGEDRDDVALELLGATFEELNLQLSEKWRLPELVKTSQGLSNSFQPRPLSIMLASALARESSRGWQREPTIDDVELLAEFLDVTMEYALAWVHTLSAEAARTLSALPIPLPAFHLICGDPIQKQSTQAPQTKPADTPVEPRRHEPEETSDQPESTEQRVPPAQPSRADEINQKAKTQAEIEAAKPSSEPSKKPANPLQDVITHALEEMHQELGLQRAMFAMLNKEKTVLKARLVTETGIAHSLREFSLELTQPTLLSLLMKKPQVIALTPGNLEKYSQIIPPHLASQINLNGCLAMSVFLRNKPIGLFYADNGADGRITANQLNNFKAICQRTISSLN